MITWIKKILWYFLVLRKKLRRLSLFIGKRAHEHKWVDKWVDKKTDQYKDNWMADMTSVFIKLFNQYFIVLS